MKRGAVAAVALLLAACSRPADPVVEASKLPAEVRLRGLKQGVEILRDRWGVPHVYARNQEDLFFANGYINARDRLFQLDLWRRAGTGRLAEVLGREQLQRDRMARLFRYRGDAKREWESYSPDTYAIAVAFTNGINAFIRSLRGAVPAEFREAGYAPGLWAPEDILARIAGLSISRNVATELSRARDVVSDGAAAVQRARLLSPPVSLQPAPGVDLRAIPEDLLQEYAGMLAASPFQGSNNWVVDGTRTVSGKPLFASDPHRGLEIPSLRRTIHLVAPGWNIAGAGEPALPGIALGHNETIAFGFTITGTDQQDLYIEKLNPANHDEYWHNGAWRRMEVVREEIGIRGGGSERVELRYTVHGPVLRVDAARNLAYALRWVGLEPGGAGYLASLALARARNRDEFVRAAARFHVPGENMLYADTSGNIGLAVVGLTPVRKNHSGLLPVPGTGEYEWTGYLQPEQLPQVFNPPDHLLATANNDIRPEKYPHLLTYEWGPAFRVERVRQMLGGSARFAVSDFERMQYDVVSLPARRFQNLLRGWRSADATENAIRDRFLAWDGRIVPESPEALLLEIALPRLGRELLGESLGVRALADVVLREAESRRDSAAAGRAFVYAIATCRRGLGLNMNDWQIGRVSRLLFRHPLDVSGYNRGPFPRPGDAYTVNAAGGNGMKNGEGASFRMVLDLADWDRSTMTNAPGEVGDPTSPHYADLIEDWRAGRYHPLPFSRQAVEAAASERITLVPE